MNRVVVDGRIVADAEKRFTPSGKPVLSFRFASNTYVGKDDTATDFFNVTAWGERYHNMPDLTKGKYLVITGTFVSRQYTKKNGESGFSLDLTATDISYGPREARAEAVVEVEEDEEMPF